MTAMPRRSALSRRAARALASFALSCCFGCIEVGHRAEVGCLVDPTEPGCTPDAALGGNTSGGPGALKDAAAADDPQDADGGTGD